MADVVQTNPPTMAPPGGHYSHAVTANGFVFVSGELPIAPDGTKLNEAPFEQQAQQVLDNVALGVEGRGQLDRQAHAGARLRHRHRDLAGVQRALREMDGRRASPARCVVPVPQLHYGFKIESRGSVRGRNEAGPRLSSFRLIFAV